MFQFSSWSLDLLTMDIYQLTLKDLKIELQKRGLPRSGRKSVLIRRLESAKVSSANLKDVNNLKLKKKANAKAPGKNKTKLFFSLTNKIACLEQRVKFLEAQLTKACKKVKCLPEPIVTDQLDLNENTPPILTSSPKKTLGLQTVQAKHCLGKSRKRILIVGDNNGDSCAEILNNHINNENYLVSSFFKPNSTLSNVLNDLHLLCNDFTKEDHVVIIAGTIDALKGHCPRSNDVIGCLKKLENTNVCLIGTAFCEQRNILNNFMYDINSVFAQCASTYDYVSYLDCNRVFKMKVYRKFSLFLKYSAKCLIFKHYVSYFLVNPFVDYNNLTVIPTIDMNFEEHKINIKQNRVRSSSCNQSIIVISDSSFKSVDSRGEGITLEKDTTDEVFESNTGLESTKKSFFRDTSGSK